MPLGTKVGVSPGDSVLDGEPSLRLLHNRPIFVVAKRLDGMEIGLSLGDFVSDGDAAPYRKWVGVPQFSAHVYYGQTA